MAKRDNAPIGNTCPMIDDIVNYVRGFRSDDEDFAYEQSQCLSVIEDVRSANKELRDWGNEVYEEKSDLEVEVKELTNQLEDARYDISAYIKEIADLEAKISDNEKSNKNWGYGDW